MAYALPTVAARAVGTPLAAADLHGAAGRQSEAGDAVIAERSTPSLVAAAGEVVQIATAVAAALHRRNAHGSLRRSHRDINRKGLRRTERVAHSNSRGERGQRLNDNGRWRVGAQ